VAAIEDQGVEVQAVVRIARNEGGLLFQTRLEGARTQKAGITVSVVPDPVPARVLARGDNFQQGMRFFAIKKYAEVDAVLYRG